MKLKIYMILIHRGWLSNLYIAYVNYSHSKGKLCHIASWLQIAAGFCLQWDKNHSAAPEYTGTLQVTFGCIFKNYMDEIILILELFVVACAGC